MRKKNDRQTRAWLELLAGSHSVRARRGAARSLGKENDAAAIPALMAALDDKDAGVRSASANALRRLRAAAAVPRLVLCLRDDHPGVRAAAAQALAFMATPECVEPLVNSLSDDHVWVVQYSARALKRLSSNCVEPLTRFARSPTSVFGRRLAIDILAAVRAPGLGQLLLDLSGDPEWQVRETALCHLGDQEARGPGRATDRLVELLSDPISCIREAAAKALGLGGTSEAAAERLRELLEDEETLVVEEAVRALRNLRVRLEPQVVLGLLDSSSPGVRYRAAEYAGEMRVSAAVPRLLDLLANPVELDPYPAARALALLASPDSIPTLLQLLRSPEENVAAPAALALRFAREPEVVAALLPALDSPRGLIRMNAASSLQQIGDPSALLPLQRKMEQGDLWGARGAFTWLVERAEPCVELMITLLKSPDGEYFAIPLSECGHPHLEKMARRIRPRAPLVADEHVRWGEARVRG